MKQNDIDNFISKVEEIKKELEEPENRLHPHSYKAEMAMHKMVLLVRRATGYNVGWIPEEYREHCSNKAGRKKIYDRDTREANSIFIRLMTDRGSSKTQAIKLLIRLQGTKFETQGQIKELRETYKHFEKMSPDKLYEHIIFDNSWAISDFLEFDIDNLIGSDIASHKTAQAFKDFWKEMLELIKQYYPIIRERDNGFPQMFDALKEPNESDMLEPLLYFYPNKKNIRQRKNSLNNLLNSIDYFSSY